MEIKRFTDQKPKGFTEECALVSVFLNMTRINSNWLLNYISPPGGAWQEFHIYNRGKQFKFYIGRDTKRVDLVLQKRVNTVLFFIGEAKETFKNILSDRETIQKNMLSIYKMILNFKVNEKKVFANDKEVQPVFTFIVGVDISKLDEFAEDVINSEVNLIEKSIDRLPEILGGRICVVAYWEGKKTGFRLVFSQKFDEKLKAYFKKIFKCSK